MTRPSKRCTRCFGDSGAFRACRHTPRAIRLFNGDRIGHPRERNLRAHQARSFASPSETILRRYCARKRHFGQLTLWPLALHCANLSIMGVSFGPAQTAKPRVFVGSSSECGNYAVATKKILEENRTLSVTYWKDLFGTSGALTAIEVLIKAADEFDFAVFILSPDDVLTLRGESTKVPRDNVIFEMGLFIGALGRKCVFLITSDTRDAKLPGDMGGVNVDTWVADQKNPDSAVRSTADTFRGMMEEMWREKATIHDSPGGRLASSRTTDSDDNEVWLQAYEAGALEELDPGRARIGTRIVHPIWGPGLVTELGPSRGGARYLTVEFPHGPATILSDNIALQKFVKPV